MHPIPRPNWGGPAASQPRRRFEIPRPAAAIALILLLVLAFGFARTRLLAQIDQLNSLIAAEQRALDALSLSLSPMEEESASSQSHQPSPNAPSVAPVKANTTSGSVPKGAIASPAATAKPMTATDFQKGVADHGAGERSANRPATDETTQGDDAHEAAIAAARNAVQGHPEILLSLLESPPSVENGDTYAVARQSVGSREIRDCTINRLIRTHQWGCASAHVQQ